MERRRNEGWALTEGKALPVTADELSLLGVCMGYVSVPQLGAKLPGYSRERMELVLPSMVQQLEEKGALHCAFGHAPQVQAGYRELAEAVFEPEAVLDVSLSRKGTLRCFLKGETCIGTDGETGLYAIKGRKALAEALQKRIPTGTAGEMAFTLPMETARQVQKLTDSFQRKEARRLLEECLDKEKAELWLTLLSGPCRWLEMRLWSHEDNSYRLEKSARFAFVRQGIYEVLSLKDAVQVQGAEEGDVQCCMEGMK